VPRADPPRVVALGAGDHAALRAAIARLASPARPIELVLARERGIGEEELPALVASASALVHLVPDAGSAVTPLEALALGTPVVVPRLPAFVEALGSEACWAEPLEAALERALASARDPAAARARVGHSRAFSWERCAREHLEVWAGMTS
jgi:glycosyltransferase involved in cell wall biosynthesis